VGAEIVIVTRLLGLNARRLTENGRRRSDVARKSGDIFSNKRYAAAVSIIFDFEP
jgi:hypothetical protein